jgi:hypothetical protein
MLQGIEVVRETYFSSRAITVAENEKSVAAPPQSEKDRVTAVTAILALIVSLGSLGFSLYWVSPIGDVQAVDPTEIGIVRGIKPEIEGTEETERLAEVPSDHIVMPLTWQNNSGTSVLVGTPKLVLQEFDQAPDDGGVPIGSPHYLLLVGEYPEIDPAVLSERHSEPFSLRGSLVLQPHSVTQNMLVFRVMGWEVEPNRSFRIKGDTHYRVSIEYEKIPTIEIRQVPKGLHWSFLHIAGRSTTTERLIADWHAFEEFDCLQLHGRPVEPEDINDACEAHQWYKENDEIVPAGYGWDFRSLVPGARR